MIGIDEEYPKELLEMVQPGKSIKMDYGPDNHNTKRVHILAIFEGEHVAYKTWLKHERRWHYAFESMYYYWLVWREGQLKP